MAEKCAVCGYFADSGRHDTVETCDAVRGPCLDPDSHHPFVGPQPAHDLLAAARAVLEATGDGIEWAEDGGPTIRTVTYATPAIKALRAAIEEADRG